MTQAAWMHTLWACLAAALWLAVYRLPLAAPRRRQRFRLAVSSRTGMPPRLVFPIVGTIIYLVGAALASTAIMITSDMSLGDLLPLTSGWGIAVTATIFAILGSAALTAFAMSVIYAVKPTVDVSGAVVTVEWISQIMALPQRWRWIVPMSSAAFEEFFFRGVLCGGLLLMGTSPWLAIVVAGVAFTTCQAILTENKLQMLVLVLSSIVISTVGGLLLVATGSVIPAIIVHASFAGFYTNNGGPTTNRPQATVGAPRAS